MPLDPCGDPVIAVFDRKVKSSFPPRKGAVESAQPILEYNGVKLSDLYKIVNRSGKTFLIRADMEKLGPFSECIELNELSKVAYEDLDKYTRPSRR
jgi:hypothetical protein